MVSETNYTLRLRMSEHDRKHLQAIADERQLHLSTVVRAALFTLFHDPDGVINFGELISDEKANATSGVPDLCMGLVRQPR